MQLEVYICDKNGNRLESKPHWFDTCDELDMGEYKEYHFGMIFTQRKQQRPEVLDRNIVKFTKPERRPE